MSFSHWWIGFVVDDDSHRRLEPAFAAAAAAASLAPRAERALARWRADPTTFDEDATRFDAERAAEADAFVWAFNLPGFDALAADLLTIEGRLAGLLEEDAFFRMAAAPRFTPVSVVWRALGRERAERLPGRMGNLLVAADAVARAERATRLACDGLAAAQLLAEARRYCGGSVGDDALSEALTFLPEGLARAREAGRGFLALARAQI